MLLKRAIVCIFVLLSIGYSDKFIDLESGVVFPGYNNVQIPRATGTKFSLHTDPAIFYRLRLTYTINNKHTISALYAPLTLHGSERHLFPVAFDGVTFPVDIPLKSTYIFNSYRLTYRYDFVRADKIQFGLGFTAKIRDAAITLQSADTISKKTNVGFVPIINFNFQWIFSRPLSFLMNGDALGAPQGRAEDVLAAIQYQPGTNLGIRFGYRILEGGANVESVYNFTLINYLLLGITYKF
jgi:hypothetical protein